MSAVAGGVGSRLFPSPRSTRLPLGVSIHYGGGAEGECVVHARGWIWRFPAHVPIYDVILTINGRPPRKS